jgi:hypothetical protein
VLLKFTTLEAMKPLPVTVSVCEPEPATILTGAIDVMLGVGLVDAAGEEGVPEEGVEPDPPQPDRTSKEPRHEIASRELRRINPPRVNRSFRSVQRHRSPIGSRSPSWSARGLLKLDQYRGQTLEFWCDTLVSNL